MKKYLLPALATLCLAGCSAQKTASSTASFNSQDFVGEWGCSTLYPDLNIQVADEITLKADQQILDRGIVAFPIQAPVLAYQQMSEGRWNIVGDELVYTFSKEEVKKAHSPALLKDLADSKKVAKDNLLQYLKKMDEGLFSTLSQGNKNEPIKLTLKELIKGERFVAEEKMGDKAYVTTCVSLAKLQELEKEKNSKGKK